MKLMDNDNRLYLTGRVVIGAGVFLFACLSLNSANADEIADAYNAGYKKAQSECVALSSGGGGGVILRVDPRKGGGSTSQVPPVSVFYFDGTPGGHSRGYKVPEQAWKAVQMRPNGVTTVDPGSMKAAAEIVPMMKPDPKAFSAALKKMQAAMPNSRIIVIRGASQ